MMLEKVMRKVGGQEPSLPDQGGNNYLKKREDHPGLGVFAYMELLGISKAVHVEHCCVHDAKDGVEDRQHRDWVQGGEQAVEGGQGQGQQEHCNKQMEEKQGGGAGFQKQGNREISYSLPWTGQEQFGLDWDER